MIDECQSISCKNWANVVQKPFSKLGIKINDTTFFRSLYFTKQHTKMVENLFNSDSDTDALSFVPYSPGKNEKYMSKKQREHFMRILTDWRQSLLDESTRTVTTLQDETINHPDPTDRASQEADMSIELRNRDRERRLIRKIEESIARLEAHNYGFCESCGVEIGLGRLEARPTATLCLDCKTLDEMKERRMY